MLSPLRNPVYRRLFLAQAVALVGTGLATVALALLAHRLAGGGAGAVLGTALAIKMAAYVGVAPLAAALAERLPRRAWLVGLDLMRAALVLALPLVDAIWQVYVLIFLLAVGLGRLHPGLPGDDPRAAARRARLHPGAVAVAARLRPGEPSQPGARRGRS